MKPYQKPVIAKRILISTTISLVQSTFSIPVLSPLGCNPRRLSALLKPLGKTYKPRVYWWHFTIQ